MGCTAEACAFRDHYTELQAEGATVLGVSRDSVRSHQGFAEDHGLPFPLLSDVDGSIVDAYHVRGWFGAARRVTYLIAPDRRIAATYGVIAARRHAGRVLNDLRTLKAKRATNA